MWKNYQKAKVNVPAHTALSKMMPSNRLKKSLQLFSGRTNTALRVSEQIITVPATYFSFLTVN